MRSEDLREELQGNSEKSQPTDETKDDAEPATTFRRWKGFFHSSSSRRTSTSALRADRRNIPDSSDIH